MTASDLVKADEHFPTITGNIEQDTETVIGELAVGTYVVERGLARLYMIWKTKKYLDLTSVEFTCKSCGLQYPGEADGTEKDEVCVRCDSPNVEVAYVPIYPTLEAYVSHISDMTGKSRQTLFNRLKVYRVLCDERGSAPESVFKLNLLSSGAASKLASADSDDEHIVLEDDSWQATVDKALGTDSKSGALEYVKYDVLQETKITAVFDDAAKIGRVFREYHVEDDKYVLEEFKFVLEGKWPDQMREWIVKRLGAKVE